MKMYTYRFCFLISNLIWLSTVKLSFSSYLTVQDPKPYLLSDKKVNPVEYNSTYSHIKPKLQCYCYSFGEIEMNNDK